MSKSTCLLKLPTSVKTAAARLAKAEGVSLNQFIAAAVAEKVGVMETAREFLERRAGDAKPKDLLNYLQGRTRAAGRIGPSIGSAGHPGAVTHGGEPSMART
jgi:hypothetical protein